MRLAGDRVDPQPRPSAAPTGSGKRESHLAAHLAAPYHETFRYDSLSQRWLVDNSFVNTRATLLATSRLTTRVPRRTSPLKLT